MNDSDKEIFKELQRAYNKLRDAQDILTRLQAKIETKGVRD